MATVRLPIIPNESGNGGKESKLITMAKVDFNAMLDAGVHFGHLKRKWNPAMAPYIFAEKKGIHVLDLNKDSC